MNRGECGRVDGSRGGKRKTRGEVRKQMDIPLHYPPFKGVASRCMKIARTLPDLL
jgi:hypothetical protein